jgi:hypothetical protein
LLIDLRRGPAFLRETGLSVLVRTGIVERSVIPLRLSLRLLERDPIVGGINFEQHIALVHELVVRDRQLDDSSRDLGRHRDDIGSYRAIARPKWSATRRSATSTSHATTIINEMGAT